MEWIMCKLNSNLGEELVVFAGKQVALYPFDR